MVIYDLICELNHEFEGWFKNSDDLVSQQESGLLTCPYCDTDQITKKLTAPKVGRKSNTLPEPAVVEQPQQQNMVIGSTADDDSSDSAKFAQLQTMLGQVHDYIDENFQDVGNRFAEEAVRIHRGEKEEANIKGIASAEQLEELAKEGVQAVPLPPKPIDKKKIN